MAEEKEQPKETKETKEEKLSIVEEAKAIRDEIKREKEELRAEREKLEKAQSESILSGDSGGHVEPEKKAEQTPKDYANKVLTGDVDVGGEE